MSNNHGRVHARESSAALDWLTGYDPGDGSGPVGDHAKNEWGLFLRSVVIAAFEAGADHAEAEHAIERSTGQRQLDDATALIREAVDLFEAYARHHWSRADGYTDEGEFRMAHDSLTKARRNLLMAVRLKEWLAGKDVFAVSLVDNPEELRAWSENPAEVMRKIAEGMVDGVTIKGVDHASFDDAAASLSATVAGEMVTCDCGRIIGRRNEAGSIDQDGAVNVEHSDAIKDQPGLDCPERRYTSRADAHGWADVKCGLSKEDIWRGQFREEGRQARRDGKTTADCPHMQKVPGGSDPFPGVEPGAEWLAGWHEENEGGSGKTREDCLFRHDNVVNFTGAYPRPDLASYIAERDRRRLNREAGAPLEGWLYMGEDPNGRGMWFRPVPDERDAFTLSTPDPRFDPAKPVIVNGYTYHPAKEA